jgi:hypothetical protein
MCDVPSIAVFCSESIECFPGTASKSFLKLLVTIRVASNITGTIVHFRFHIRCISIHKLLYYYYYYYYLQFITAAEIKLLRPLRSYTIYGHKTNDSVRREIHTECMLETIDEYRRNWLLHLQRMPLNRIPLKSYHYKPQGRRTIGRPKKRCREQL